MCFFGIFIPLFILFKSYVNKFACCPKCLLEPALHNSAGCCGPTKIFPSKNSLIRYTVTICVKKQQGRSQYLRVSPKHHYIQHRRDGRSVFECGVSNGGC